MAELVKVVPGAIALQSVMEGYLAAGDFDGLSKWFAIVKPCIESADPNIVFQGSFQKKNKQYSTLIPASSSRSRRATRSAFR